MGSDPSLPNKAMEEAVAKAKQVMQHQYQSSHSYRWWSRTADWMAFFLTAAITVIVGTTGQVLQGSGPAQPPPALTPEAAAALGRKWMRWIGLMAAVASVMLAVSGRLGAMSQERMDRGEKLREQIVASRVAYSVVANPVEGQKVVDNLEAETAKTQ
jgi:hypothetical protein